MKKVAFAFALIAVTTSAFAQNPKNGGEANAASSDPILGKWKVDRAKGEDMIWTFSANGSVERHIRKLNEKGTWKRINDQTPPSYQCVLNGGAAVVKVTYSANPEHLSMRWDDNSTRATAKRFEVK